MKLGNIAKITLALIALLAMAALSPVNAATDFFLQFGPSKNPTLNIAGESTDPMFKGAMTIQEFTFGMENATTIGSATSGIGAGKAKFNNLEIKRKADRNSPKLFQALAMGAPYNDLTLSVRNSAGTPAKGAYYVLKFTTVFVTKIDVSSGEEGPMETITLAYGALEETVTPQDTTGALDPTKAVKGTWSQITNSATTGAP